MKTQVIWHRFYALVMPEKDWNSLEPNIWLPAGLVTFYTITKPLGKTFHVMGPGYNPSVGLDEIQSAAIIHL